MKTNTLTLVVGALLVVIFLLLLFTFQVRQTEVVVVTTFDKPTRFAEEPGLKFKWPYPIQKLYRFDKRVQNFEDDFEETLTRDNYNLLAQVYMGWTIANPTNFFNSFPAGTPEAARPALKGLIRSAKNAVVGQHSFADFISTDANNVKFAEVENRMLAAVKDAALQRYGVGIQFLGIKKLGLPASVTEKVIERMNAERQREVDRLKAEGEAEAMQIKSAADLKRTELLAKAEGQASDIRARADREAAQYYAVFEQHPELALLLMKANALEQVSKDKATLIFDANTAPFDLLKPLPAQGSRQGAPSNQANANKAP